MLERPGYATRTGIRRTARSKIHRATLAANGALGVRAMEGHLTAAETVISDPFLWLMEWTAKNG